MNISHFAVASPLDGILTQSACVPNMNYLAASLNQNLGSRSQNHGTSRYRLYKPLALGIGSGKFRPLTPRKPFNRF